MTDRQCLRCGDPLQSSSAISNYCMPCQMRLASSIDTERAGREAAEARVKVLEEALMRLVMAHQVRIFVARNLDVDTSALTAARAALKEPANG